MRKLDKVSLVCIDCYSYGKAVSAIQKSLQQIQFEKVLFLTDIKIDLEGIEAVQIPSIRSKREYSEFVIKKLANYIPTDYFCLIQADGYIIDGNQWDDRYFDYDYIGAPWLYDNDRQVGNGGSSFRTKRLHEILANDETISVLHPEDQSICIVYKFYLEEKYGIKFAPVELAEKYSYELRQPNQPTFSFHGNFHAPFRPYVVLKRTCAMGDIILMEPVMRYYAIKNYNVVLDIPAEYFDLFKNHYFPVIHISNFDKGRITPEMVIDLDMAYEVKPRQNYIKSYFQFCGVEDYVLSKPQLSPECPERLKPFKKYCVVHIDNRETLHRNIYGVDWSKVGKHLTALGYTIIQIGKGDHIQVGTELNTVSPEHLKFYISACDLFIGVDSGPSHIAIAYNKPCVIFFGSVNPNYIHADLTNVEVIQGSCDKAYCWHQVGGTAGKDCEYLGTKKALQCCYSQWEDVTDAIDRLITNNIKK